MLAAAAKGVDMKLIYMPFPHTKYGNKVVVSVAEDSIRLEHRLPELVQELDENGVPYGEPVNLVGYVPNIDSTILFTDLEAMAASPDNAHTVWLYACLNGSKDPQWINKFKDTLQTKEGFRKYWDGQPMLVLAQYFIPPFGLEPSLVLTGPQEQELITISGDTFDGVWETNSVAMAEAFPLIDLKQLSATEIQVSVKDGNGVTIPCSGEMRLETTAGALSNLRPVVQDGTAVVVLSGVTTGTAFKIKAGFKYYTGVEELALVA